MIKVFVALIILVALDGHALTKPLTQVKRDELLMSIADSLTRANARNDIRDKALSESNLCYNKCEAIRICTKNRPCEEFKASHDGLEPRNVCFEECNKTRAVFLDVPN